MNRILAILFQYICPQLFMYVRLYICIPYLYILSYTCTKRSFTPVLDRFQIEYFIYHRNAIFLFRQWIQAAAINVTRYSIWITSKYWIGDYTRRGINRRVIDTSIRMKFEHFCPRQWSNIVGIFITAFWVKNAFKAIKYIVKTMVDLV